MIHSTLLFASEGGFFSDPNYQIIIASTILMLSFFFGEVSKRTSVPSVLLLIITGIAINLIIEKGLHIEKPDFNDALALLGTVGLIMIVLEAALELELKWEKLVPIAKAFGIAAVGLGLSTWAAAELILYFIPTMTDIQAWIYATPLSILSSAIIIPSVTDLRADKKEFHIYESTFSDILGIILFYYLKGTLGYGEKASASAGLLSYLGTIALTIVISIVASYAIILIFQNIKSHAKLFLLIAVLLFLYAIGKTMHLSSLIIILVFGLMIANMKLFFQWPPFLKNLLRYEKAHQIYDGLHVVTMETAFVVRTFFFVTFGITITLSSLASIDVAIKSLAILASIYIIRYVLLRIALGKDILPQLYIAPRGLITVLLFTQIPASVIHPDFESGILLFIIIGTSLIMTYAMIRDKNRTSASVRKAQRDGIGSEQWTAPSLETMEDKH